MDYKQKYLKYKNKYLKQRGGGQHKDRSYKEDAEYNSIKHDAFQKILIIIKEFEQYTGLKYNVELNNTLQDICMHVDDATDATMVLIEHLVEHPEIVQKYYSECEGGVEGVLQTLHSRIM